MDIVSKVADLRDYREAKTASESETRRCIAALQQLMRELELTRVSQFPACQQVLVAIRRCQADLLSRLRGGE